MRQRILVDSGGEYRGFFSSVNLTLLTVLYCSRNDIDPIIGNSVLSLYRDNYRTERPFSRFFGQVYDGHVKKSSETLEISEIYNNNLLSFYDTSTVEELRKLNNTWLLTLTPTLRAFIDKSPGASGLKCDVSIHYRGTDYLKNTPAYHKPNLSPQEFVTSVGEWVRGRSVFVATDDITFIGLIVATGIEVVYFDDVYRRGPGLGSHVRSKWQRLGLPALYSQEKKGFEVFRDCWWLSRSDLYIGSNSNLMYYSGLLNSAQIRKNVNV